MKEPKKSNYGYHNRMWPDKESETAYEEDYSTWHLLYHNKYLTDGFSVYAGDIEIARAYVGPLGYSVALLQGMDRNQTIQKIILDCPEFAAKNNLTIDTIPKLFTK